MTFRAKWHVDMQNLLSVWYKTKFGSQDLATNFGNHLQWATI